MHLLNQAVVGVGSHGQQAFELQHMVAIVISELHRHRSV